MIIERKLNINVPTKFNCNGCIYRKLNEHNPVYFPNREFYCDVDKAFLQQDSYGVAYKTDACLKAIKTHYLKK